MVRSIESQKKNFTEMVFYLLVTSGVILLVHLLYKLLTKDHDKFKKIGLKSPTPLPLIGTNLFLFLDKKGVFQRSKDLYKKYSSEKMYGTFDFMDPIFYVRDLDLIKKLFIKDFNYFQDRREFPSRYDELFGNSVFLLQEKRWSQMRSNLSSLFTGKKMRYMFNLIEQCAVEFVEYLNFKHSENSDIAYNAKEIFNKVTLNTIGSCVFGVNINALDDTEKNDFLTLLKTVEEMVLPRIVSRVVFIRAVPKLARLLNIRVFKDEMYDIYKRVTFDTMKMRKQQNIECPDLIQLLMKLRENSKDIKEETESNEGSGTDKKPKWTDEELVGQAFLFYFGGFDNSSTIMNFCAHELAASPDIQEKLFDEIYKTNLSLKGSSLTYDTLINMKYLDWVCTESLRKYPPIPETDRVCVRDYHYKDDNFEIHFKKGDTISIPIMSLHMDEKHFENPEKFYPERYSEENQSKNNMDAFMTFGIGQRQCIGSRLGIMQIKLLFYRIILNFKIVFNEDAEPTLRLKPSLFMLEAENPIKIKFIPRNN